MDFLPIREEGAREFVKTAKKGLRYGEDVFFCVYSYDQDHLATDLTKEFLKAACEDVKKPYGKFLVAKGLLEQVRTAANVDMIEIPKEVMYKLLMQHIPASDLLDVIGVNYLTKYYKVRLISGVGTYEYSEEGGNVIYLVISTLKKEIALVHTTFM